MLILALFGVKVEKQKRDLFGINKLISRKTSSIQVTGALFIVVAMTAEAAVAGITKSLLGYFSLMVVVFLRLVMTSVFVMPWVSWNRRLSVSSLMTAHTAIYLVRAAVTATVMLSFLKGIELLPIGVAICLFHTYPILLSITGCVMEGRRFTRSLALQLVGCLLGVAFLASPGSGFSWEGFFWVQLAAVLVCVRFLIERRLRVEGETYANLIFVNSALMAVMCGALAIWLPGSELGAEVFYALTSTDLALLLAAALLAIVSQLGVLWAVGQGMWEKFSVLSYWEIVAGFGIGVAFFSESLSLAGLFGMALIVISSAPAVTSRDP